MKKKTSSMMNAGRIIRRLALVCGMIVLTVTMIPSSALAESNGKDQYIGEAGAKSIALENAGITEQQATFIKAHLDGDDGLVVYDVEFYSGNQEYEYEIDAVTGEIRESDREIEYYTIPPRNTDRPITDTQNNPPQFGPPAAGNADTGEYIGEAKAKAIALSAAGRTEDQFRRIKVELDYDDGKVIYEVEFKDGRMEYEYEIDAVNGAVLEADVEYDD